MQKFVFLTIIFLQLLLTSYLFAQQPASQGQILNAPNVPRQITIPSLPPSSQPSMPPGTVTPKQLDAIKSLSPEQQRTAQEIYLQKGASPEALEALKTRPEFQGLDLDKNFKQTDMTTKKIFERQSEKRFIIQSSDEISDVNSIFLRFRKAQSYQDVNVNLKPFGFEFFKEAAVKVITDRKDIPVPADYILGPGDEVRILLWGRVNAQYNLIVDRDGNINVPTLGPIQVAGLTFEQMASNLIKQAEQIVGANINVTMGALKSIPIFILGDVKRPGAYMIGSFSTITDALLLAGGPSDIGSMRNIQLRRKDKVIAHFDLYDLLLKGDKSKDLMLQAGDVVFVPVTGALVGIAGNVKRPAIYEIRPGTTLAELFDIAGGLLPTGHTQQIQVERIVKNDRQIVLDIDDKNLKASKGFVLQDADLIKIFNLVGRDTNAIFLYGNVRHPGKYEFKPGMKLLDLIKDVDSLLPETYMQYANIVRFDLIDGRPINIAVNLDKLLLQREPSENFELQPQDTIYIYSKWSFKDRPTVYVEGEVRQLSKKKMQTLIENTEIDKTDKLARDRFDIKQDNNTASFDKKDRYFEYSSNEPLRQLDRKSRDIADKDIPDITDKSLLKEDIDSRLRIESLTAQIAELKLQAQKIKNVDPITYRRQDLEIKKLEAELANLYKGLGKKAPFVKVEILENYRIKDAILQAGGLTNDAYLQRGILIRLGEDKKPKTLYFNVAKAMQGDEAENLLLQDEDRIIIRSVYEHQYKQTVDVQGEVLNPGKYPYSQNMRVSDLIFVAGNVLESAFMQEAELSTQKIVDGRFVSVSHRQINLAKALAGDPEHDVLLSPYDTLTIKKLSDWAADRYVEIKGEVAFPGRYKIKKGERLSDLIQRAGGFTANAYPKAAVFTRERVREMQQKSIDEMVMRLEREFFAESAKAISTSLSAEEVQSKMAETEYKKRFLESLRNLKPTGRMTIMLTSHMRLLKGSEYDIELENGDTLLIPEKNSVVNVMGSVMSQSSLIYSPRLDYRDYIDMAGGVSTNADTANIYVLKADGSARRLSSSWISWGAKKSRWELTAFDDTERDIEPGDTIVVPEKVEKIAWLREIKDITQILMQIAVTAGVVIKLF